MSTDRTRGARRRLSLSLSAVAVVAAFGAAFSCGGEADVVDGPRQAAIRGIGEEVVLPSYRELAARAEDLAAAAARLQASPDGESLAAARAAWRAARGAYERCRAFAFGPSETLRIPAKVAWTAIRPDRIEQEIAAGAVGGGADVEDLGADRKGLLALEYLLFEPGGETATLRSLQGAEHAARRAYVSALADNASEQLGLLLSAWEPEEGDFLHAWTESGRGGGAYEGLGDAVDALVNQMVFLAEDVADRQLLAPLGGAARGEARPDLVATLRSASGIADARNDVVGLQRVYFGRMRYASPVSLSVVVHGVSGETDTALRVALAETLRLLDAIPPPLAYAVLAAPQSVEAAQERAAELRRTLEIDLVSALGSTLRFNPSDGD